ncbi:MAG: hypothetical protein H6745_07150 [Deltaproteobacteria bacterium]|nr:hypothetical protein [Deltaproteobacteria bacterium]
MTGDALALLALLLGAPEPAPPWPVCLVAAGPVDGAEVGDVGDAVVVEARKRGRVARVGVAPEEAGCEPGALPVVLGATARVGAGADARQVGLEAVRPADRAAVVARLVAAVASEREVAADGALVGELPPAPEVAPEEPEPVPVPPVVVVAPGEPLRVAVGLLGVADPGAGSLAGRLDVSLAAPVVGRWLAIGARIHGATPTTTGAAPVTAQHVEAGADAVVTARAALGARAAVAVEAFAGGAYRWTTGVARATEATSGGATTRGELVAALGGGLWLAWDAGGEDAGLWLAIGAEGARYLGGTDLEAPAGRADAPRWAVAAGLRVGVRLP